MNADEVARRIRAFHRGEPLPLGRTRHFPIAKDKDLLILAFVRMGGESLPWGIAFGHPGGQPTILTVPEPRNRDLVAEMVEAFASHLLTHFRHPAYGRDAVTGPDHHLPLRQVWLPNQTHLDMLHFLAYAYTFTRAGTPDRVQRLRALGRLAGWLFRESRRPGQVSVMVATDALRAAFTFPAETVRQAHLGFLLAWLEEKGGRDARLEAAREAERLSIATSLDPAEERDVFQDLVDRFNEARTAGDAPTAERVAAEIRRLLEPELRRRFELTERAVRRLRTDPRPENRGVERLIRASREEHWYQYVRLELEQNDGGDGPAFVPSPETDRHPAAAASRYMTHESAAELAQTALLHDDPELQALAVAAGDAFHGTIVGVRDRGNGRATRPFWTIETDSRTSLRLREGSNVCVAGLPDRIGRIRRIETIPGRGYRFEVEITKLKTRPRGHEAAGVRDACDRSLVGEAVTFVKPAMDGISRFRSRRVWKRDVPGAWLTHAVPDGPRTGVPDDDGDGSPAGEGVDS